MSLIFEKLKKVGQARDMQKTETLVATNPKNLKEPLTSGAPQGSSVVIPRGFLIGLALALGLSFTAGITSVFLSKNNSKNISRDVAKILSVQNTQIRELNNKVAGIESRQKQYTSSLDTKVADVKTQALQADKKVNELSASLNQVSEDIKTTRFLVENIRDRFVGLSSEMRALKILTATESAATIVPERKTYGENN